MPAHLPAAPSHVAAVDLETLLNRAEKKRINLKPRYQRGYIWGKQKAYRLIESVMGGLFVPAVVTHAKVVDGMEASVEEEAGSGGSCRDLLTYQFPFTLLPAYHRPSPHPRRWRILWMASSGSPPCWPSGRACFLTAQSSGFRWVLCAMGCWLLNHRLRGDLRSASITHMVSIPPFSAVISLARPHFLALQDLTKLTELNGKSYCDLPEDRLSPTSPSRYDFDSRMLPCTKLLPSTTEEAVLRVYEDLNAGAEQLNKQQVGGRGRRSLPPKQDLELDLGGGRCHQLVPSDGMPHLPLTPCPVPFGYWMSPALPDPARRVWRPVHRPVGEPGAARDLPGHPRRQARCQGRERPGAHPALLRAAPQDAHGGGIQGWVGGGTGVREWAAEVEDHHLRWC